MTEDTQVEGPGTGTDVVDPSRRRRVTILVTIVCLALVAVMTVAAVLLVGPRRPAEYGDWLPLDRLWDACAEGDAVACDELFVESPVRSEYEEFGTSCGGRFPGTNFACVDLAQMNPEDWGK
ncbi:MAG: hypothetical protein ACTHXO_05075 [Actinomycetaceae bacterium]